MPAAPAPRLPDFSAESAALRAADWQVAAPDGAAATIDLSGLRGAAVAATKLDAIRADCAAAGKAPGSVELRITLDSLPAVFEAEEILHASRDFAVSLSFEPLAYLLDYIRRFSDYAEFVLPDRADITAATPCLVACRRLLNGLCRRRGARFEAGGERQELDLHGDFPVEAADLLQVPRGRITASGIRDNIRVALTSLAGLEGADPLAGEFAEAQLWQWLRHATGVLDSGEIVDGALFAGLLAEAAGDLLAAADAGTAGPAIEQAARVLEERVNAPSLPAEAYPVAD